MYNKLQVGGQPAHHKSPKCTPISPTRSMCGPLSTEFQFHEVLEGQLVHPSWCLLVKTTYLQGEWIVHSLTCTCLECLYIYTDATCTFTVHPWLSGPLWAIVKIICSDKRNINKYIWLPTISNLICTSRTFSYWQDTSQNSLVNKYIWLPTISICTNGLFSYSPGFYTR